MITPDEILTPATSSRVTNHQQAGFYFDKRRTECVQVIENLLAVAERCLEIFDTEGAQYALRDVIDEMREPQP